MGSWMLSWKKYWPLAGQATLRIYDTATHAWNLSKNLQKLKTQKIFQVFLLRKKGIQNKYEVSLLLNPASPTKCAVQYLKLGLAYIYSSSCDLELISSFYVCDKHEGVAHDLEEAHGERPLFSSCFSSRWHLIWSLARSSRGFKNKSKKWS